MHKRRGKQAVLTQVDEILNGIDEGDALLDRSEQDEVLNLLEMKARTQTDWMGKMLGITLELMALLFLFALVQHMRGKLRIEYAGILTGAAYPSWAIPVSYLLLVVGALAGGSVLQTGKYTMCFRGHELAVLRFTAFLCAALWGGLVVSHGTDGLTKPCLVALLFFGSAGTAVWLGVEWVLGEMRALRQDVDKLMDYTYDFKRI